MKASCRYPSVQMVADEACELILLTEIRSELPETTTTTTQKRKIAKFLWTPVWQYAYLAYR